MPLRDVFINQFGRLRSGWRLLIFVGAFIAAFIALSLIFVVVLRVVYLVGALFLPSLPYANFATEVMYRLAVVLSAIVAGYICARFLEELPLRSLGLGLHRGFFRDLVVGSIVGGLALTVAVGIVVAMGGLRFSINSGMMLPVAKSLIGSGGLLFVAALAEEAIFRGYPLQTLSRAKLAWLALLLTSVPFGALHLKNPNVIPAFTFANTTLAGLWLGVAYLKTRSLWFPWGVHWAWNFALGAIFGLPVSGLKLVSHPLFNATDVGPRWLTGGSYGIEGGIACTIALIVSIVVLWFLPWPSADPELKRMTSEETPATPQPVLSIQPQAHTPINR